MGSCLSTENHSAELRNLSNSDRGLWAEDTVLDFLIQKKWSVISKRKKYKFGEIDLIVERNQQVAIIEIKFLHNPWMAFERLHHKQLMKLITNFNYLKKIEFRKMDVKLFLCFVSKNKEIIWINLQE